MSVGAATAKESSSQRVVLFPVDGSVHCERAFNWYLKNMKNDNDSLKFVSVIEPLYTPRPIGMTVEYPPFPDMEHLMKESIDTGKDMCRKWMQKAKNENMLSQAILQIDSKPGQALVKSIGDNRASVVVMANRGLGMFRRTFLGSVSDYVLHHANVPVVIVPPSDSH